MALECYQCSGTEDYCKKSTLESNQDKYLATCPIEEDHCYRFFLKKDSVTHVTNNCTSQFACTVKQALCDKYADDHDITCEVGCCDKDACNVSSHVSFNVILLTVCSALGLALLM